MDEDEDEDEDNQKVQGRVLPESILRLFPIETICGTNQPSWLYVAFDWLYCAVIDWTIGPEWRTQDTGCSQTRFPTFRAN